MKPYKTPLNPAICSSILKGLKMNQNSVSARVRISNLLEHISIWDDGWLEQIVGKRKANQAITKIIDLLNSKKFKIEVDGDDWVGRKNGLECHICRRGRCLEIVFIQPIILRGRTIQGLAPGNLKE